MRLVRRIGSMAALALVGVVVLAGGSAASAPDVDQFYDVPPHHPFHDEIDWLADVEVTTGFPDGRFRAELPVSRQAMAAYLHRFWAELGREDAPSIPDPGFSDVPTSHPYYDDIAWLAALGVTTGFPDGTFRPSAVVSRQAMAAYLHRFWTELGHTDPGSIPDPGFTDVPVSHPFHADIAWLADRGITEGYPDGTYRPTLRVTRGATAAYLHRFWYGEATVFVVDSALDALDAAPGDGVCATAGAVCSLRAAVTEANAADGQVIIDLQSDATFSRVGEREDQNLVGDLDIDADLAVLGHGHVVNASYLDRVIDLRAGRLRMWHTSLTRGRAPNWDPWVAEDAEDDTPGHGGGIRAAGPVSLYDSAVTDSRAGGSVADFEGYGDAHGRGGALFVTGYDIVLREVLLEGNSTSIKGLGGGIHLEDGDLRVRDSVVAGNIAGIGGGIRLLDATATIEHSVLNRNEAHGWYNTEAGETLSHTPGAGGALATTHSSFTLRRSTVSRNVAVGSDGGAIHIVGLPPGPVPQTSVVEQSTISGNVATVRESDGGAGGAISADVAYALDRSTVADNHGRWMLAGAGFSTRASIISTNGPNDSTCQSPGTSGGYNLASGGDCLTEVSTDQELVDPLLAPLHVVDGLVESQLPYTNSPARRVIPPHTPVLCEKPWWCAIGAEPNGWHGVSATPRAFVVTVGTDGPDVDPGNGLCAAAGGDCTLRAALDEANAYPTTDQITLGADVTLSIADGPDPRASAGDLVVADDVWIDGGGHTIDAAELGRVIDHRAGRLDLFDVTLTGGWVYRHDGGGIRTGGGGLLRLEEVVLADNVAWGEVQCCIGYLSPANGGGIFADTTAVEIERSLLTGNHVVNVGEGNAFSGVDAHLTVLDSTFSANTRPRGSGTATLYLDWGSGTVDASTFVETSRILGYGSTRVDAMVRGSILDSTVDVCDPGGFASGGHNLVSDDSCGFTATGDQQEVDALLGPLADNGGPTWTHLPGVSSPAVDAVPGGTAALCTGARTDQRNVVRPQGAGCDIGAVERRPSDP
jgi:CSLREA domain-containing protein